MRVGSGATSEMKVRKEVVAVEPSYIVGCSRIENG